MNTEAVVQLIVSKGVKQVNLSMFSETEKKTVLQQAAEIYLRQGKTAEVVEILEYTDLNQFAEIMRPVAEQCVETGDYKKAALIYEKIGYHELAEFIRENFVKSSPY